MWQSEKATDPVPVIHRSGEMCCALYIYIYISYLTSLSVAYSI